MEACMPPQEPLLTRCACAGGVKLLRRQHHGASHHWRPGVPAAGLGAGTLAVRPPVLPVGASRLRFLAGDTGEAVECL